MKDKVKNFIEIVREIKMKEEEREAIRVRVSDFLQKNALDQAPAHVRTPSPYWSRFSFSMTWKMAGVMVVVLIAGVAGLAQVSAKALPGDLLYSIKIAKENFEERLASTPEEKIALKEQRIATRFSEVETLIKEKKITPENRSIAETKIEQAQQEISADLDQIHQADPAAAAEAKTTLNAAIEEHQQKIDDLIQQTAGETDGDVDGDVDISGGTTTTPDGLPGDIIQGGTNPAPGTTDTSTGTESSDDVKVTPGSGTATTPPASSDTPDTKGAQPNKQN